jgi:hypothetical protein
VATFSIDIDDADVDHVLGAIAAAYGRDPDSIVPVDVFARQALIGYIKGVVANQDRAAAQAAALAGITVPDPGVR